MPQQRARKGELEARIKSITDAYVMGQLNEGDILTPHRIRKHLIIEEPETEVSVGAVAACLKRWQKIGFAEMVDKPFGFDCYTEDAEVLGLRALKNRARTKKKNAEV